MITSNQAGISQRTNVYAERQMLKHAEAVVVLEKTGPLVRPMPKNKSLTIKFRRPIPFAEATTPLTEGVTPGERNFGYEDVSATLSQYGDWSSITDVIEDTHEDPVLNDLTLMHGENIGRTKEALNYAVLRAGTNVFYANGAARNVVNTPISLAKQRAITRTLKAQKAQKVSNILDASIKIGTKPVEAAYVAVGHTDLESDIRGLPGFIPTSEYGTRTLLCEHEIGRVEDVRYILSPDLDPFINAGGAKGNMVSQGGANADVYPILYFGREAWGIVPLKGPGAISPVIIPVGKAEKSDPLAQRGTVGWKMWHVALILNQLWMARLEVASSEL
ncbi:N4-gp56 family major capsid protein [Fulvimarina endophytica]|uniref:N4-gp56 family major capsid protein n=1 Tax=Fulvimarina endophytica TaxID=2293836 RepID=A0A371X714_9HYPH|nr:N4-gp56 family major capsid protein [Fulvimarina endophytica]RFC65013.1 N4-gp56 family major capsid protein [Fulvimarina endophytica]